MPGLRQGSQRMVDGVRVTDVGKPWNSNVIWSAPDTSHEKWENSSTQGSRLAK